MYMTIPKVFIRFLPNLYTDLLKHIFQTTGSVEVIETGEIESGLFEFEEYSATDVDIIVLSLDQQGKPELSTLPYSSTKAKVLAFSPKGDYGLRRLPGEKRWEEVRPFGLVQLLDEVLVDSYPRV